MGLFAYYGYVTVTSLFVVNFYVSMITSNINAIPRALADIFFAKGVLGKHKVIKKENPNESIGDFSSISVEDLSFTFGDNPVIRNFTYKFNRGGKYLIKGRSGSGKSTLIYLITGLLTPTSGKILWNGNSLSNLDPRLLLNYINVISTDEVIIESSLRNNLTMFSEKIPDEKLFSALKILGLDNLDLEEEVGSKKVSAGEMQRILLSRAIVDPREILILDEALSNLDQVNRERIENYFLSNPNLTLIHITHHLKEPGLYDEIVDLGD